MFNIINNISLLSIKISKQGVCMVNSSNKSPKSGGVGGAKGLGPHLESGDTKMCVMGGMA